MKKLLLLVLTLSFVCVANAQEDIKYYAIDGKEYNDRFERDSYEDEIKYERKCNLFSLQVDEKVRESLVKDTIVALCDEYDEYTDKIRELEMFVSFGFGPKVPTTKEAKERMKKRGITLGEFEASNKEFFRLKEFCDIYNIILADHQTILKLATTIAEDETVTDANVEVEKVIFDIIDRYANEVMTPLDDLFRNMDAR